MKRLGGKAIDKVTWVHRVIAVLWILGAAGSLFFALRTGSDPGAWAQVRTLQWVASSSSVAMLFAGGVYAVFTEWGFLRHRILIAKWGLYLAGTAFGGPAISMAKTQNLTALVVLTVLELAVLIAAMGIGVRLMRGRQLGRIEVG